MEIRYNWGVNDRLDRMEYPQLKPDSYGAKILNFVYTPAGNRVRKTYKDNVRTYTDRLYIYNGAGTLVEEFDIKTNKLETIHAGNIRIEDNRVEYDFRDMLSSTVLISDASGKVLQRYRYDPFGEIEQAKGNSDNRFLFNGKEADESGLSYYGARYYNSITGRWISRDPLAGNIFLPHGLNRYQFCYNNPVKNVDPDGRAVIVKHKYGIDFEVLPESEKGIGKARVATAVFPWGDVSFQIGIRLSLSDEFDVINGGFDTLAFMRSVVSEVDQKILDSFAF